ncbi:MAG: Fis family transcriptional regulator [Deltaproteobacteria bacterium]|nr:Fis family transcriptional regulator [Deltaproteobacteria bacterium]
MRLEELPLGELVRRRLRVLLDGLGPHRAPDLMRRIVDEVERVLIEEALERAGGSRKEAAAILGIHRNSLRSKIRRLGLK